jgi:hypothetical protein
MFKFLQNNQKDPSNYSFFEKEEVQSIQEKNYKFFKEWKKIIDSYILTIDRIEYDNIPVNDLIQKPYYFKYFNELIKINNEDKIKESIKILIIEDKIEISDIIFILNHLFLLKKEDKKKIQNYFYKKSINNDNENDIQTSKLLENNDNLNILSNIIFFYLHYYLSYLLINELIYKDKNNDILNYDILFYVENDIKKINNKVKNLKKNNKMEQIHSFILFYNLIKELSIYFDQLYINLSNLNLIPYLNKNKRHDSFIRFLFLPWFKLNNKKNNLVENDNLKEDIINNIKIELNKNNPELNKNIKDNNDNNNKSISNFTKNKIKLFLSKIKK